MSDEPPDPIFGSKRVEQVDLSGENFVIAAGFDGRLYVMLKTPGIAGGDAVWKCAGLEPSGALAIAEVIRATALQMIEEAKRTKANAS